jgi:hypothetical protein
MKSLLYVFTLLITINAYGWPIFGKPTYEIYFKKDINNCNSQYEDKPSLLVEINYKKEPQEIFLTYTNLMDNNEKKLVKLNNCEILNEKNWTCRTKYHGRENEDDVFTMINGKYKVHSGAKTWRPNPCPTLIKEK